MKSIIISIGDELLIGQVVNTNASWLANELNAIGISVLRIMTIGDSKEEIVKSLQLSETEADIILITGGLGPTKDDITKRTLTEYFDTHLVINKEVLKQIEALFALRGWGKAVTEINRKQAEVPANCLAINNPCGTAPAMWFEKNDKVYISLPGVPFEMEAIMEKEILPMLSKRISGNFICQKTILTQGVGESFLSEIISDWEDQLPAMLSLAYLPQPGMVRLRLTAKGSDETALKSLLEAELRKLQQIIPQYIWGYDHDTLEAVVGKLLLQKHATLATAESCTGGYVSHLITSVAGSSAYFMGGVISYDNRVKLAQLKVSPETLLKYGAVSKETVEEMAKGVQQLMKTDYAIAVSGIAGPDGGTVNKPIGTIWIAIATPNNIVSKCFLHGEHRGRNIRKAALSALNMLREELIC
ncbi:MAG: competence/damage-inducible protein A [Bacteroidota bacterium]